MGWKMLYFPICVKNNRFSIPLVFPERQLHKAVLPITLVHKNSGPVSQKVCYNKGPYPRKGQTVHLYTPCKYLQHLTSIIMILIWSSEVSCLCFLFWSSYWCLNENGLCVWNQCLCWINCLCFKGNLQIWKIVCLSVPFSS